MQLLAANNAQTVLASGINASATALTVATGKATLFPVPVANTSLFKLTLTDAATESVREIMHVTAVSGDTFTVVRAQEGTSARAWSANDIVANMVTAGTLNFFAQLDSPTFIGDPKAPTPAAGDADTSIATTGFVDTYFAKKDSPTFTGDPKAPTPAAGDNDTSIATTAFVTTAIAAVNKILIATTVYDSSGTWTPNAKTTMFKIREIGGGGAGGSAGANSGTTISVGSGGASGSYAEAIFTIVPTSSVVVSVGVGGTASISGGGGTGGTTSVGSLLICPGGGGGAVTQISTTTIASYSGQGAPGNTPTMASGVGGKVVALSRGQPGFNGLCFGTAQVPIAGFGAPSTFGGGGIQPGANVAPTAPISPGSGGAGTSTTTNQSAVLAAAGAVGKVIIEEYGSI